MLHEHGSFLFGPNFIYIKSISLITKLAFILPNYSPKTRIGPHNEELISVIVGSLLGDCHAERLPNGGVRFRIKQSVIPQEYFFWLYEFFKKRGYCSNNLPIKKSINSGSKIYEFYLFSTYAFSSFIYIYKLFYNRSKKKVIPNNIAEYLTPLALAIWIQDDGTFKNPGVRIATNSYSKEEVELLKKALETKFNLKSTINKNNGAYQLHIKKESIARLKALVLPHMVPSMYYKLGL